MIGNNGNLWGSGKSNGDQADTSSGTGAGEAGGANMDAEVLRREVERWSLLTALCTH